MKEQYDFPAFTAYVLETNILHVKMKKVSHLSAKDVIQVFDWYKKISDGGKIYVLVTFAGFIPMSMEAMAEAKKSIKSDIHAATAYVVTIFALHIVIKFFMNFYMPNEYPMSICRTQAEAISWLKQEKRKNAGLLA